ncbi:SPOR domain-containing protein [Rarobacter incanus]|uniref:Sporulation related protein n=1 Tax=Rarobacter incanus TaxID=153494 RepID=A0A542SML4_9MICO|nr:SPOR domain-containing protein [Rarobacter incanus]TQK75866.1 hypothetical protein FB389_0505 [Rarobacter incanus]
MGSPSTDEYYFNTLTGKVERGQLSSWTHLMGPYPSPEAAQHAFDTARQRTKDWDDEDKRWGDEEDD